MLRLMFVAAVVAASAGCGGSAPTRGREPDPILRASTRIEASAVIAVPDNPADRDIRRALNLAIARDSDLKGRSISFIVANGDVSVTGTVRTEEERRRINDVAMNLDGVKSVANALLIAE